MHPALVALLAILTLALWAPVAQPGRLHVNGLGTTLNDQVGYIVTARQLLDTGRLESTIIMPAKLAQPFARNVLYMPGHYLWLAATFALLGYGEAQSVLAEATAYVVFVVCTFVFTRKLFGREPAWVATALLLVGSPCNVYALSAMSELTLLAAISIALCVFVHIPARWRPVAGPVLLALPFFVRETAALFVLPLMALADGNGVRGLWPGRRTAVRALVLLVASVLLLVAATRIDVIARRPGFLTDTIFSGSFEAVYTDAYHPVRHVYSASEWLHSLRSRLGGNVHAMYELLTAKPLLCSFEQGSLRLILMVQLVVLMHLMLSPQVISLCATASHLLLALLLFSTYRVAGLCGTRLLMATLPLGAALFGRAVVHGWERIGAGRAGVVLRTGGTLLLLSFGTMQLKHTAAAFHWSRPSDHFDEAALHCLETLRHDPATVLACDYRLGLVYALRHYPTPFAFVPANDRTLELLAARHPIGTLITEPRSQPGPRVCGTLGLVTRVGEGSCIAELLGQSGSASLTLVSVRH